MPSQSERNLAFAFAAESRCAARLAAYAQKAAHEGQDHLAHLFRALAEAHEVHARRYLLLLRGKIGDTAANLRAARQEDISAHADLYPAMAREAAAEGQGIVATALTQAHQVELRHLELLGQAQAGPDGPEPGFFVCQVCGYLAQEHPPERCPVCGAVPGRFKPVV